MSRIITPLLTLIGSFALWQLLSSSGLASPAVLASPVETLEALPRLLVLPDLTSTIKFSALAFALSVPIGVLTGAIVYFVPRATEPGEFVLDFLRSIPVTALVPVFFILISGGDATKLAVACFGSSLLIATATVAGLRRRNGTRRAVAAIIGLHGLRRAVYTDLPDAAPQIFLGLKAGVSLSLVLVVVAEMIVGANFGLGKVINDMRGTDDKPLLYAALLACGIIGYCYNWMLAFVEKRLIHWS